MGGFIKCTLRDNNKITTSVLSTNKINDFLSDYDNIFKNDIHDLILKHKIKKEKITESYHEEIDTLSPFDYGYIFIDRINKKAFFLNNYDAISHFSNFDFEKENYEILKKQNFKIKISNFSTKKANYKDVRKEFVMRDFREYRKLFTALPYIKTIKSIDKEIDNISSLESILDELKELRSERKQSRKHFINDLIITEFKDWTLTEDNKTKDSFINLFEYLKNENLLSQKDIQVWNKKIEEVSDD